MVQHTQGRLGVRSAYPLADGLQLLLCWACVCSAGTVLSFNLLASRVPTTVVLRYVGILATGR